MATAEVVLARVTTIARRGGSVADARTTVGGVDAAVLLHARRGATHAPADVRERVEALLDELIWTSVGI
jgi:hypothetical protein